MKLLKENFHYLLFLSSIFFIGNPAKFPADDGFFYPQIAYNVVHHGFMGFNDLYLTNGFHPLWMLLCTIAELLNPFDKTFVLYIIWLFQALLVLLGYILLEKTIFKESKTGKILCLAFYVLMFFSLGTLYLTEAHLAFFTICLLIFFVSKKIVNDFVFGLICSLVFLARLDHIFIVIPFGFLYWNYRKWSIKSLVIMLFGFSVLSIPYLLSNLYLFDSFVPISGRIKSSFPHIQDYINFQMLPKVFMSCGIFYFIFLIVNKKDSYTIIKFSLLVGSLIHLLYNLLFQSQIGQWYFVSQMLFCGLFIFDIVNRLRFKVFQWSSFNKIIIIVLLIFVCAIGWLKMATSFSVQNNVLENRSIFEKKSNELVKQTAQQLEKVVAEKSRIYVYDFPGKFAFYSNFNVIPADGLVANTHFFNEIKAGKFRTFLTTNKVEYLLFPTHFPVRNKRHSFLGIYVNDLSDKNVFYIRNTLHKTVIDSINENELYKVKSYSNPIKTWQPEYDSISLYMN